MQSISENVRQDLVTIIPPSAVNEITCFVFYDNHPRSKRNINVIICTRLGDIKEYFKRQVVSSVSLETEAKPTEITLFRNSKCDLFYLVSAGDELIILNRGEKLQIQNKISNVDSYEIVDAGCSGISCLKVLRKDDAVPVIFDDNLESIKEQALFVEQLKSPDMIPLIKDLMRKHTEAKFAVKTNEKAYKEALSLRQTSAYSHYEKLNPNSTDTLFNSGFKAQSSGGAMKVKAMKPCVKVCNKRVVIAVEVLNNDTEPLEDVHVLLHHTIKSSINYKSKLFKKTDIAPYWQELESQNLQANENAAVVCTIDLKELKCSISNKIVFNSVICYKFKNKEFLLSLEDITLTATEVMGEKFDVLYNIKNQKEIEKNSFLAMLATTMEIDVRIRLIKSTQELELDFKKIFVNILKLENFCNAENVFVHNISPFHILYGVMVILEENYEENLQCNASIHVRSDAQVLALMHYIHDSVPCRVIITPVNYKIRSKNEEYSKYNEDITPTEQNQNIVEYGKAVLNQSARTLEYLDQCMIKMNETKDPSTQSKLGSEIDIFADGVDNFKKFCNKMLEEASKGSENVSSKEYVENKCVSMIIEIDD